jgi:hypothetical protein
MPQDNFYSHIEPTNSIAYIADSNCEDALYRRLDMASESMVEGFWSLWSAVVETLWTQDVAVCERLRGTVIALSGDMLTVHTHDAADVPVAFAGSIRYVTVMRLSLDRVDLGSYIGIGPKTSGNKLVALAVVVPTLSVRGAGEGHYAWDRIPDATLSGGATTASTMTSGTVSSAIPMGGSRDVDTMMTNGSISNASKVDGAKQIIITACHRPSKW